MIICESIAATSSNLAGKNVANPIGGDSFVVRNFDPKFACAYLLNLWGFGGGNVRAQLLNNQFIDQVDGVWTNNNIFPGWNNPAIGANVYQKLFNKMVLTPVIFDDSGGIGQSQILVADIFYDDLNNVGETNFIDWPEFCKRRGRHIALYYNNFVVTQVNQYNDFVGNPLSTLFVSGGGVNYFKPYKYYAIRGVDPNGNPQLFLSFRGNMWGNTRLTMSINFSREQSDWFLFKSRETGLKTIPVFQGIDADKVYLSILSLNAGGYNGTIYISELDSDS